MKPDSLSDTLINSLPNPILIHADRVVVFANAVVPEITGLPMDQIIGRDLSELLTDPNDPINKAAFTKVTGDHPVEEVEIAIRTANRKVIIKNLLLRNRKIRYKGKNAILTIIIDITDRINLEKYIVNKVMETEEKDRQRFAADLHDDLGPILSSIKLHLGIYNDSEKPAGYRETMRICNELLAEAIAKMRIIANNLMPRLLEKYGLEPALNAFISTVQKEGIFMVQVRSNLDGARFPRTQELHLYRILCELINNTVKHSGATSAAIILDLSKGTLSIRYSDNGKGYRVDRETLKRGGMGLNNIIQRVNLIDGEIKFIRKNGSTEVRIKK
jgi:PAS domain S-box-containing protein